MPLSRRDSLRLLGGALAGATAPLPALAARERGQLGIAALAPGILRIGYVGDPALGENEALADAARKVAPQAIGGNAATLGGLTVRHGDNASAIEIAESGSVLQRIRFEDDGSLSFDLGTGPLLGLGQGGPQFDRRGSFDRMVSGQGGYRLATHGSRVPIPWLINTSGNWALFIADPAGAFDLTGPRARFLPSGAQPVKDVFFVRAHEPAGLMQAFALITGFPEMPPLWAFGYQQSHRTLGTPEETLAEARRFRDAKLPCDAMIYLGTGFCPNGWNSDNGEFTWNARVFPDPAGAIRELHANNFKIVVHVVVEGHEMIGRVTDPCTASPLPSGRTPEGKWPPRRQVACYWPYHKPLSDLGVDGWWPDQGDGFDPPSRLARNRMYFEGQQLWRPNQRVYALHRNGFAGMQRFAAFLWSGDVESRWETLRTHIPVAINTALSGIPYWGTDIGGFVATEEYTGELYARWFQFAAFTPLFRSHGRDWRMHTPWGWTDGNRGVPETAKWQPEPETLKDPRIEPICRRYLELRYRLIPYLYSAVHEANATGLPILRALWLHYPDDPAAVATADQYLFGRDLLVAPVVERGATERRVYLPRGAWYDFWTGARIEGGRTIVRPVDLATVPLYVRAGTVLPLGPVRQNLSSGGTGAVELRVYPGADGEARLYEDDGETFDYRQGRFELTQFVWNDRRRQVSAASGREGAAGAPRSRDFAIADPAGRKVGVLQFDGRRPVHLAI